MGFSYLPDSDEERDRKGRFVIGGRSSARERSLEHSQTRLRLLSTYSAALGRDLEEMKICARLVEGAMLLAEGKHVNCHIAEHNDAPLFCVAQIRQGDSHASLGRESSPDGHIHLAHEQGEAIRINRREDVHLAGSGDRPLLIAPIACGESRVGVLQVVRGEMDEPFSEEDEFVIARLADHAAIAICNARTLAETHATALTDVTTNLPNRRSLDQLLESELAGALRYNYPLSILMIDIDDFKIYNDASGHLAGDEHLRRVAAALTKGMRSADFIARYGGDEFILVAPHTDGEGAIELAERVRSSAEGLAPHAENLALGVPGCTVSIGIATLRHAGQSALDLLQEADEALKAAKSRGRNRVGDILRAAGTNDSSIQPPQSTLASKDG